MFTTPCFIRKNTPELRKRLEELGYENRHLSVVTNVEEYPLLQVYRDGFYNGIIGDEYGLEFYIDCGTNEELFIALAALRDDKPDYQWFLWEDNDGIYHTELEDSWRKYIPNEKWEEWWWFEVRKATVEELIEHFSDCLLYKEE